MILLLTITQERIIEIPDDKFESTINFIKEYKKIYSLNYGLLLYWVTEKLREKTNDKTIQDKKEFTDGFYDSNDNEDYVNI